MHVGLGDPLYGGGGGLRMPGGGAGGRGGRFPPGARYDPIGPRGLPVSTYQTVTLSRSPTTKLSGERTRTPSAPAACR